MVDTFRRNLCHSIAFDILSYILIYLRIFSSILKQRITIRSHEFRVIKYN